MIPRSVATLIVRSGANFSAQSIVMEILVCHFAYSKSHLNPLSMIRKQQCRYTTAYVPHPIYYTFFWNQTLLFPCWSGKTVIYPKATNTFRLIFEIAATVVQTKTSNFPTTLLPCTILFSSHFFGFCHIFATKTHIYRRILSRKLRSQVELV